MTPSFEAYKKYAMAMRISSNDIPAARALLHAALSLDPDFAAAWSELALLSQDEGDSAVLLVQEALRRPDRLSEADRFYNEAMLVWIRDEDYAAARNLLDRVVSIEPTHKNAGGDRCTALARLALYEEAVDCYHRARTQSPFGRSASRIRAHAGYLISAGQLDEARRVSAELTAPRRYQRYLSLKLALASADWTRAESLATAYLADPTSQVWVHGRSQLALASVLAARGAVRRADSVLSEASGAHPFGIAIARSLLVTMTGLRVPSTRASIDDTLYSRFLWEMARDLAWGDTTGANRSLQSLIDAGSEGPNRRRSRRYHEEHVRLAHTLGNAHRSDWEQTARGARAQLSSLHGAGIHLFSRWLLATSYDALALPDSAVVYFEQAAQSSGLAPFEMFSYGIPYSFAHQRLVILYSGMGRVEDARRHWAIFRETFTDPDPEYAHLIEEARAALERAERKAG